MTRPKDKPIEIACQIAKIAALRSETMAGTCPLGDEEYRKKALKEVANYSKQIEAKLAELKAKLPHVQNWQNIQLLVVCLLFEDCGFTTRKQLPSRQIQTNVVGFHSLRHSFVSFCANAGVPMAVVQSLVGHGSPAMTRHYTHISPEAAANAIQALPIGGDVGYEGPTRIEKALELLQAKSERTNVEETVLKLLTEGNLSS